MTIRLTHALGVALIDATHYHMGQVRKCTDIPYISHPMAVASLVLEAGGDEHQAIAALLHDAVEDNELLNGESTLAEIRARHGAEVARIVEACSDVIPASPNEEKPAWRTRKEAYLAHLRSADEATMLVSAADKLHNLRSIANDYARIGDEVWQRFNTDGDKRTSTLWYYGELYGVYRAFPWSANVRSDMLLVPMGGLLASFQA